MRRKIFGRKIVFHLVESEPGLEQILLKFDCVNQAEIVGNKILAAVDDPELNNPELIKALVGNGAKIQFVGEIKRRLEDVYLELMQSPEEVDNG